MIEKLCRPPVQGVVLHGPLLIFCLEFVQKYLNSLTSHAIIILHQHILYMMDETRKMDIERLGSVKNLLLGGGGLFNTVRYPDHAARKGGRRDRGHYSPTVQLIPVIQRLGGRLLQGA